MIYILIVYKNRKSDDENNSSSDFLYFFIFFDLKIFELYIMTEYFNISVPRFLLNLITSAYSIYDNKKTGKLLINELIYSI